MRSLECRPSGKRRQFVFSCKKHTHKQIHTVAFARLTLRQSGMLEAALPPLLRSTLRWLKRTADDTLGMGITGHPAICNMYSTCLMCNVERGYVLDRQLSATTTLQCRKKDSFTFPLLCWRWCIVDNGALCINTDTLGTLSTFICLCGKNLERGRRIKRRYHYLSVLLYCHTHTPILLRHRLRRYE